MSFIRVTDTSYDVIIVAILSQHIQCVHIQSLYTEHVSNSRPLKSTSMIEQTFFKGLFECTRIHLNPHLLR